MCLFDSTIFVQLTLQCVSFNVHRLLILHVPVLLFVVTVEPTLEVSSRHYTNIITKLFSSRRRKQVTLIEKP